MLGSRLALTSQECQQGNSDRFASIMTRASEALVPSDLDGPMGVAILAAAADLDPLSARAHLARQFPDASPETLRAAAAQAQLRQRAAARFPNAERLWWTADGLEQASRPAASAFRVDQLRAAGISHGVDLTCGLGLDLLAMATAGLRMVGVEQDPVLADLATRNIDRTGLAGRAEVVVGSCTDADVLASLPAGGVWFVDPARRTGTRQADGSHMRLRDPEQWSPPWSWVLQVAQLVGTPTGPEVLVAKASPAIAHDLVDTASVQWLSESREVVEATVWWGVGAPGSRCAVILPSDPTNTTPVWVCAEDRTVTVAGLPDEAAWLIEPDPAIIRAGAVSDLGALIDAQLIDEHLAYLSATAPLANDDLRGRCWRVLYSGRYHPASLRQACASAGVTRVELSGRGRRLDPQRVNRELRLPGGPGTIATLFSLGLGSPRRTAVVLGVAPAKTPLWK